MSITSHRYERTHNGRVYTTNYYGKLVDTETVERVATSIGVIELKLYWKFLHDELLICADMWQGDTMHGSGVTTFRATVHMRYESGQYRIISDEYRGCNAFWVELEGVIQRAIDVNE